MKIDNLTNSTQIYTSNVFFLRGDWNTLDDVNTLIDVGRDPSVIEKIKDINTGVGKQKVQRVILTHNHYDHTSLLPLVIENFNPAVYSFSSNVPGVDQLVQDGDTFKIGDSQVEVLHTPYHTTDSICLYCPEESCIFTGDTPLIFDQLPSTSNRKFFQALKKISNKDIQTIYPGHGKPQNRNVAQKISETLDKIENKKA